MIGRRLGRIKSPDDSRDLRAASYMANLPDPPTTVEYARSNDWPIFANDRLGDCTVAAMGHQIQVWTVVAQGKRARLMTTAIIKRYEEVSGYTPGDESTDVGANERDVLKLWLKEPLAGHSLTAFARVGVPEPLSITQMQTFKQALWVFGGLYLGLDLPLTAQVQIERGQPWDVISGSPDARINSWGGHAVNAVSYSAAGVEVITWGRKQLMTWSFLAMYCSEIWGLISTDWLKSGKSPQGFDLATLQADLAALRSGS